jgi:hypothetical protein
VIVNAGVDADTPLVDRLRSRLAGLATPDPRADLPAAAAWDGWLDLLGGDGIDPGDPRALLVWREHEGRVYRSGSACLVALGADGVRFDFTAIDFTGPAATGASWYEVPV